MNGYLLMRLRKFEFETKGFPSIPANLELEQGTLGFLQVFDTMENAHKAAEFYNGDTQIVRIEASEEAERPSEHELRTRA